MKSGVGLSRNKDFGDALNEAYRLALKDMGALKADLVLFAYTYDYALDTDLFTSVVKRVFKETPHMGCSTWSAWTQKEMLEGDSGIQVLAMKDLNHEFDFLNVHSLKEKSDLWAMELSRQLQDVESFGKQEDALLIFADSLNFSAGQGFEKLKKYHPELKAMGLACSYGIPQCSVVNDGKLSTNSLAAWHLSGPGVHTALLQSIQPEANEIRINRMSENLLIEIDEKPAFYRLCEHLMEIDDLPMMAQDEFRKYMGNLYIVERHRDLANSPNHYGEPYRVVSLLGSEMTTGMVAVGDSLNFDRAHYLGQKKTQYAEEVSEKQLQKLKDACPSPSLIIMLAATSHFRDQERKRSDTQLVQSCFPQASLFGIGSQAEFFNENNTNSCLIIAFD